MAGSAIDITTTPPDLLQRMARYPDKLDRVMRTAAEASLLVIHENVPPYPDQLPDSSYVRTGTLGRSMGVGMTGGQLGKPSIYLTKKTGSGFYEGEFGSRLDYAPDVIGEGSQKPFFAARGWWTTKDIARLATSKIVQVYEAAARHLVAYLEGMG